MLSNNSKSSTVFPESEASKWPFFRKLVGWLQICFNARIICSTRPCRLKSDWPSAPSMPSISAITACMVFSYNAACCWVSNANWFCSTLSGKSEMMLLSVFMRRIINGDVILRKRATAASSLNTWMGSEKFSLKDFMLPKYPLLAYSMMDQNSVRRFSTGVPLIAMRRLLGMLLMAFDWLVSWFLMFCASSMTIICHFCFFSNSWSLRKTPYVVNITSASNWLMSRAGP